MLTVYLSQNLMAEQFSRMTLNFHKLELWEVMFLKNFKIDPKPVSFNTVCIPKGLSTIKKTGETFYSWK